MRGCMAAFDRSRPSWRVERFSSSVQQPNFSGLEERLFFEEIEMGRKLYVGNLSYDVADSDLSKMFEAHGTVESAQVIMDRDTGRSKGFGFVEMKTDQEAQAAIAGLNGQESGGRSLTVNEARPREERGGGGGGRRGGGGYGGGGGGGGRGGYGGGGGGGGRR